MTLFKIIWIIFIIKKIYNVYKIMINMIKYEKKKENSFVLKQIRYIINDFNVIFSIIIKKQ